MRQKDTILIVDDERLNLSILEDLLESDYDIMVALSGKQALNRINSGVLPDLILLDIMMPDMDGYTLCHHIKSNPKTSEIPVMFVSAMNQNEDEEKGLSLGAVDYVTKPIIPDLLKLRVKNHLTIKRQSNELNVLVQQQIQDRKDLEKSQAHLRRAQAIANLGSWDFFIDTGVVHFSPQCYEILGVEPSKNLPSLSLIEGYMHPDDRLSFIKTINDIKLGREKSFDLIGRIIRPDGMQRYIHQTADLIQSESGRPLCITAVLQDITEQRKTEEELRQYRENLEETVKKRTFELEKSRDAAEAGARSKASFLANMSHEIRTPMNAIIGFAEIALQDSKLSEDTYSHIKTLYHSARSLLSIINDILDVSKIESGRFELEKVNFHLENVLHDALRILEHKAQEKSLLLHLDYASTLSSCFMGDPTRLKQVVLNLVGNAIKFTEQGEVVVSVEQGDVENSLHFSVKDSGIGMTPEQVEKVFVPFTQANESTTRRFGGTGLGTTISKQIVELMGGEIWVESEIGEGSTFHFTILIPEGDESDHCLYQDEEIVDEEYISPRLFNILLAEDIEANATLAKLRLERQGHTVQWAKNGREAVRLSQENEYDLVLMDVMMPELDGMSATKEIRQKELETGKHLAILALTASIMQEDYARCISAEMDGVEGKPINFNRLFKAMEMAVEPGQGKPNHNYTTNALIQPRIDFSPLEGAVDYQKGLKNWQDGNVYYEALLCFSRERANDAKEIETLLLNHPDDNKPASAMAHALKGLAGNLAIEKVAQTSAIIDAELKAGKREVAQKHIRRLHDDLQSAVDAIMNLEKASIRANEQVKMFSPKVVQSLMERLLLFLDELNPEAVEPLLNELAGYLSESDLKPIRKSVSNFEFDLAKKALYQLADKINIPIRG